ncbi:hypothetical protein BDY24DRAFT_381593 [Mrakia frigida]|uniref:uncharacterized protein n=1 Tax=Mrakia frigida TaxID=29902 RepID=UPI003FCC0A22
MSSDSFVGQTTSEIRTSLDLVSLEKYLQKNLDGFKGPMKSIKQFNSGQSNPTYLLRDVNNHPTVLRRKPPGVLLSPTAHAIEREHLILSAIQSYNEALPASQLNKRVPAPRVYGEVCTDEKVVGSRFYLMEFLEGRIFGDVRLQELAKKDREECWIAAVAALSVTTSFLCP